MFTFDPIITSDTSSEWLDTVVMSCGNKTCLCGFTLIIAITKQRSSKPRSQNSDAQNRDCVKIAIIKIANINVGTFQRVETRIIDPSEQFLLSTTDRPSSDVDNTRQASRRRSSEVVVCNA
jgi:hypothetical protein